MNQQHETGSPSPDLTTQRQFWNTWNLRHRIAPDMQSLRRGETVVKLVAGLRRNAPRILEIGCSTGWLSKELAKLGPVTGTDLANDVIEHARTRVPEVRFVAGDFLELDLEDRPFDVVVSLEVLAHVRDKALFCDRVADLLAPGGHFVVTTQNRYVWERTASLERPTEMLQSFLSAGELRALLRPRFQVLRFLTIIPAGDLGLLRVINSAKLNRALGAVVGRGTVTRAKEFLGFGNTLVVLARKR